VLSLLGVLWGCTVPAGCPLGPYRPCWATPRAEPSLLGDPQGHTIPAGCPLGPHHPCWVTPRATPSLLGDPRGGREEGTVAQGPPPAAGCQGRLQPSSPCLWEHRVPPLWGCRGRPWDALPN